MPNKEEKVKIQSSKSQIPGNNTLEIWDLRFFSYFLFLFSFFLFFSSGCKEPDISSLEVIPESERLGLLNTDTATLISFTLPDDSIRSDETSLNLLGTYNDPVFGIAQAAIYTQIRLSAENVLFGNPSDLIVDSVILSLAYYGIYGNTSPQSFKVYELAEVMSIDSNYYSTRTFLKKTPEIGSAANLVPNLSDSVVVDGIKEPPQLRISLNKTIGDYLLKAGNNENQTNSAFLEYFKGLLVILDSTLVPVSGEGAIIYFNMLNPYSRLTVYYQNAAEADTLKFDFLINDNCARLTNFKFDRSGTSIFPSDSIAGNNLIFIQSMAGTKCKIKFPFLENFIDKGRVAINKAEIIFNVEDNSTTTYSPHSNLFLTDIDSAGNAGFLIDQFEGAEHYGGTYNSSTKQYVFNITRHVQYLLTNYYEGKNYNYGMYLMAGGKAVNANRTILKGNKNTSGALKLKISYTPL